MKTQDKDKTGQDRVSLSPLWLSPARAAGSPVARKLTQQKKKKLSIMRHNTKANTETDPS